MFNLDDLLKEMAVAADDLLASYRYSDEHPEDPHGSDDIDYRRDHLDAVVARYLEGAI